MSRRFLETADTLFLCSNTGHVIDIRERCPFQVQYAGGDGESPCELLVHLEVWEIAASIGAYRQEFYVALLQRTHPGEQGQSTYRENFTTEPESTGLSP